MSAFPKDFENQMHQLLKDDTGAFFQALESERSSSIRWNPSKERYPIQANVTPVPWCADAFYVDPRPKFTQDPYFHAGHYYVQDASSMLLDSVFRQIFSKNDKPFILDLCAAPGGKSTHLLSLMEGSGLLVANEVISQRVNILKENLTKWGYPNYVITQNDPAKFKNVTALFDLIVVDAPCSGEGLFRKDQNAKTHWSLDHVHHCSLRQKRILMDVLPALKDTGFVLYSTCTYNRQENEEIVLWAEESALEVQEINLPNEWGVDQQQNIQRCYPHRVKGEGFSFTLLKKQGNGKLTSPKILNSKNIRLLNTIEKEMLRPWVATQLDEIAIFSDQYISYIPKECSQLLHHLSNTVNIRGAGISIGEIKANQFIPHHALSQTRFLQNSFPLVELDQSQAISYLKGNTFDLSIEELGWQCVKFQKASLGWIKLLKNRFNNYYPKNFRIRN